jgi:hypothetical protein
MSGWLGEIEKGKSPAISGRTGKENPQVGWLPAIQTSPRTRRRSHGPTSRTETAEDASEMLSQGALLRCSQSVGFNCCPSQVRVQGPLVQRSVTESQKCPLAGSWHRH